MVNNRNHIRINGLGFLGFFFVASVIFTAPEPVRAQTAGQALVEIDLAVPALQRLDVNPGLLGIPSPASGDFARGCLDLSDPIEVEISSNIPWILSLRAAEEEEKAPLFFRVEGSRYLPLDTEWRVVARGDGAANRERIRIDLRILLSWTGVVPGLYEPRIEYRLAPSGEEKP
ncbi:MAG: hypothetical protein JW958_02195 [Candidatus Eisenbacteria bacterium]|nr:hypothetical protein [Candidatus Eisenbacteria bacterium]